MEHLLSSTGKVCVLTKNPNFIRESIKLPIDKDIFTVRVTEIDGEIDSFFNGYLLNPSDDDNTTLGDLHGWHDDDVNDGENVEFSGKNDNGSDNNTDKEDENDVKVIASDGFPNLDKSNGPRIPATSPEAYSDDGSTSAAPVVKDKDYTNANADFFGSTRLKSTSQGKTPSCILLRN
ncbi:hypothetical protein Tco_0341561 [Tanacetum coccineum]